jgi:tetratricopeptide (TPR) repeat protein
MKGFSVSATRLLLAAVLLLASAAAAAAERTRLPKPKDRWIRVTTPNFVLFSNAPEKMTRRAGANLEELRSVLRTLFGGMSFSSPVPTYLFVFNDSRSFAPYGLTYDGKAKQVAGYFGAGRYANHVTIVANQYSSDVSSIIYHEYLHYLMHANHPSLPLWLDEGLAEFYSTFDVIDGAARIGYPVGRHLSWLRQHPMLPISSLIEVDHASPEYNEESRRGDFYAQSWALTHMLVIGRPDGPSRTARYAQLLRRGLDPGDAFRSAFDTTFKDIEIELRKYVSERRFRYLNLPVETDTANRAAVADLPYPEVLTRLGALLTSLGSDRYPAAEAHFRAALQADPSHGPAVAGLGRLDELAGRPDEALARYRRAVELDPDDFMANFLLGRLIGEVLRTEAKPADERSELVNTARSALKRAAVQRSSFGEAWAELGSVSALEPRDDEMAVKALEHASRLLPKRGDIGYNLTALYASEGRIEDAESVIARMRATGADLAMVHAAERLIPPVISAGRSGTPVTTAAGPAPAETEPVPKRTEGFTERYNDAVQLVNAGQLEAAATALEGLLGDELTEPEANSAAALLERVRAYIAFTTSADRAVALSNRGDFDAAIAILEPLVEQPPAGANTAEVEAMLVKLYGYRDFQSGYNRAVDLFNDGRYDDARRLLEPLVDAAPTPRLETLATGLLQEIVRIEDGSR